MVQARNDLCALAAHDSSVETWLRQEVIPASKRLLTDPNRALSVDQVRQHLIEKRKRAGA